MSVSATRKDALEAYLSGWEATLDPSQTPGLDQFLAAFEIEGIGTSAVQFRLNLVQRRIVKVIEELEAQGLPIRIIILKARQLGCSTLVDGRLFEKCVRHPGNKCLIMADDDENTQELYQSKVRELWGQIPSRVRPEEERSNRRELTIRHGTSRADKKRPPHLRRRGRSYVRVMTAGKKGGRGAASRTLQHFHGSEVAFWDNDYEILNATLQTVHEVAGTSVVLESTANGASGAFFDRWKAAEQGRSSYVPLFFPWFIFPEYVRPFRSEDERKAFVESLTPVEQLIMEQHSVTLEQINWRRFTIEDKCGGDPLRFQVEYPATADEAFVASGTCRFDKAALALLEMRAPKAVGRGKVVHYAGKWVFMVDPTGPISVYRKPVPGREYIVAFDSGTGIAAERYSDAPDFSAACVYERRTRNLMARFHDRMDPRDFGDQLVGLGYWYGTALLAGEANSVGTEVLHHIQDLRYPNIYKERAQESAKGIRRDRLGYYTSVKSREIAIASLASSIAHGTIELAKEQIAECRAFITEDGRRWEAKAGHHDDEVIAAAIFSKINQQEPYDEEPFDAGDAKRKTRVERWEERMLAGLRAGGDTAIDPHLGSEW